MLDGIPEPEMNVLYTMGGFLFLLFCVMVVTAINSYRLVRKYNAWKNGKIKALAEKKSAIASRYDGYIEIHVEDGNKSLLHDILKGFEEYARLKGYQVRISIDTSKLNKILLKITEVDFHIPKTDEVIKKHLEEYITKIKNGEFLDDIPVLLNPVQHEIIMAALKNRIYFLQHTYQVEKNTRGMYEKILSNLSSTGISGQSQIFNIGKGEYNMDQRKYIAIKSANVMQGDGNTNSMGSATIHIGDTHAEKQDRIEGLENLIAFMKTNTFLSSEKVVRQLENIKDELLEEKSPDTGAIEKWLSKARVLIKNSEQGSNLFNRAKTVFDSFGVLF